ARGYGNSNGTVEAGVHGWAAVTAESHRSVARHCRDGVPMDLADALVAEICDKEVAAVVNGHRDRELKARADRRTVVATEPHRAVAGHGRDRVLGNSADTMVECIGDKDIARVVRRHPLGKVQTSTRARAVIAAEVGRTITGHGGDGAARVYLADTVVECVGDKKIAVVVNGHSLGNIQATACGSAIVVAKAACTVTCHGGDDPWELKLADAVVEGVGDKEVVVPVHGHSNWEIQARPWWQGHRHPVAG